MAAPFPPQEYLRRVELTQARMNEVGLDALFVTDPGNINWLCGYDAWSFYVPQALLLEANGDPLWMGREMDAGAASFTTYLDPQNVVPVPEDYVQRPQRHSGEYMGDRMVERGLKGKRIGYEADGYYLSPRWLDRLRARLGEASLVDADLLVNWCRLQKSPLEIAVMETAARIAEATMETALQALGPGVRQSALMSEAVAAQVRGIPGSGGHLTALYPLVLAGEKASTAHPMWGDEPFEQDQTVAFELGGCRHRYNVGLARTAHLGRPPGTLMDTAKAVEEGMEAVLANIRAGITCDDVHGAWQRVLNRYGLEKKSRIGYAIGIGYAPDWGERTISLRPGEEAILPENAVLHVILGMWMEGWGMELSETIQVCRDGGRCLTRFPRAVHIVD